MFSQEAFDINYCYHHYCYCTFIHCYQKMVSHNLEKKLIKLVYKNANINFVLTFKILSNF